MMNVNKMDTNIRFSQNGEFAGLLNKLIELGQVSLEKLSEGICSKSMLSRIRSGERVPNKFLRDRLLGRLGIDDNVFESFLYYDEYIRHQLMQKIVTSIICEDYEKAYSNLSEFYRESDMNKVEEQFCIMMYIYILQEKKAEDENILMQTLYEKAIKATVPNIDLKPISELLMSIQELNISLDYKKYKLSNKEYIAYCDEILAYVNNLNIDHASRVKILPKIAYCKCNTMMECKSGELYSMLDLCNSAIDILRQEKKAYYLKEILELRRWIFKRLHRLELSELEKENNLWLDTFKEIFTENKVEFATRNNIYLYHQHELHCINDVIKIRRKMMGLTIEELCEGICSPKTIMRVENHDSRIQMSIMKRIFERLHLSGEYQRS